MLNASGAGLPGSCETLGKSFKLSVPQFSHLLNKHDISIYSMIYCATVLNNYAKLLTTF